MSGAQGPFPFYLAELQALTRYPIRWTNQAAPVDGNLAWSCMLASGAPYFGMFFNGTQLDTGLYDDVATLGHNPKARGDASQASVEMCWESEYPSLGPGSHCSEIYLQQYQANGGNVSRPIFSAYDKGTGRAYTTIGGYSVVVGGGESAGGIALVAPGPGPIGLYGKQVNVGQAGVTWFVEQLADIHYRVDGATQTIIDQSYLLGTNYAVMEAGPALSIYVLRAEQAGQALGLRAGGQVFATAPLVNLFGASTTTPGGGVCVLFVGEASAVPTANPVEGFYLYVDPSDSRLKARGPNGTVTVLAEP